MTLSLVITAYHESRKYGMIERAIEIGHDSRITEIIICDDASEDFEDTQERVKVFAENLGISDKLHIKTNKENLGVFGNKLRGIRLASSEWIQSLDSDNFISERYLGVLENLRKVPEEMICPSFAQPQFDYRTKEDQVITLDNLKSFLYWKAVGCFVNTGNQCFHRETMLEVMKELPEYRHDRFIKEYFDEPMEDISHRKVYDSADSFLFNKYWLLFGGSLKIGKGLEYFHTVDENSSWKAAPKLKKVMPAIYFRELLDAAVGVDRNFVFHSFCKGYTKSGIILKDRDTGQTVGIDENTGLELTEIRHKPRRRPFINSTHRIQGRKAK